jgi:FRG domain-containing protein/NACHT domain-containing protein
MSNENEGLAPPLRASSFQQLFEQRTQARRALVKQAQQSLTGKAELEDSDEESHTEIWYRGVPKKQYPLRPSLLRYSDKRMTERDLYAEFVENMVPERRDWHTLFEMQHNFIPTRLLDWTPSFSVALHFALSSDEALDNPCIWVLHPGLLNSVALPEGTARKLFSGDQFRSLTTDDLETIQLKYTADYVEESLMMPELPLAMTPEAIFPRLRAQRGRFTVQGRRTEPLDKQCSMALQRIVISNTAIEEIRDYISVTGTDAFSIFPDVVGLASFLKQRHDLSEKVRTQTLVREITDLWKRDLDKLKTAKGSKAKVSITGIENCAVEDAYLRREDNRSRVEQDLSEWVWGEKGGIHILTGEAGGGKTNCLVNLVASKKPGEQPNPGTSGRLYEKRTVIWFPLFRFSPEKRLLENLDEYLRSILNSKTTDLKDALTELLRRSDTILILDGLDELARTQGEGAAEALVTALKDLPLTEGDDLEDAPKVLISCRHDIYNRLRAHFETEEAQADAQKKQPKSEAKGNETGKRQFKPGVVSIVGPIGRLSKEQIVAQYPEIAGEERLVELLARYPLFLKFRQIFLASLRGQSGFDLTDFDLPELNVADLDASGLSCVKLDLTKSCGLFGALLTGGARGQDGILKALGRIARRMLNLRKDSLEADDFQKATKICHTKEGVCLERFFSLALLRERNGEVRFLHHTIREFVLAWNIHHSLTSGISDGWDMLLETSHLDYEGAEVHETVAELEPPINWEAVRGKWESIEESENRKEFEVWEKKNHFAWCSFETAGMLGFEMHSPRKEQRKTVLDWICEVFSEELDGRERNYSLRTMYNAARCLERLHPSAPECYCEWVVDYRGKKRRVSRTLQNRTDHSEADDDSYCLVRSYAVRGFQRSELAIRAHRSMRIKDEGKRGSAHQDDRQEQFSKTLLDRIGVLKSSMEISESQRYVLVNMTHALIRWYSQNDIGRVDEILEIVRGRPRLKPLERNLRLTLWYWDPSRDDPSIIEKDEDVVRGEEGHRIRTIEISSDTAGVSTPGDW